MPLFEFQCQSCGWINEVLINRSEDYSPACPMRCEDSTWSKILSVPAEPLRAKSDVRFPHVTHMKETFVNRDGVPESRRLVANSRSHMEHLMREHDYVYYEEPVGGGTQAQQGQMPAHLRQAEEDNPLVRRYLDMKKDGRIPEAMVLTDDELQERFHVD